MGTSPRSESIATRLSYENVPVENTDAYPFNAICKIETDTGMGTGFYIGPDTLLTAAHVVSGASSASTATS